MRTDDLIEMLARGPAPAGRGVFLSRLVLAILAGLLLGLVLLSVSLGPRTDIGTAAPLAAAKALFSAFLATLAGGALLRAAQPVAEEGRARGRAARVWSRLFAPLAVAAVAGVLAGVAMWFGPEGAARFQVFASAVPWCVLLIPAFGLPAACLVLWALRDAAPTRLGLAGAAAGALSGSVGAMVYALYCPVDSVAFVALWYATGIALSAALGALAGLRWLRW